MIATAAASTAATATATVTMNTTAVAVVLMVVSDTQYQIEQWYQSKSQYHGGEYSSCQ